MSRITLGIPRPEPTLVSRTELPTDPEPPIQHPDTGSSALLMVSLTGAAAVGLSLLLFSRVRGADRRVKQVENAIERALEGVDGVRIARLARKGAIIFVRVDDARLTRTDQIALATQRLYRKLPGAKAGQNGVLTTQGIQIVVQRESQPDLRLVDARRHAS